MAHADTNYGRLRTCRQPSAGQPAATLPVLRRGERWFGEADFARTCEDQPGKPVFAAAGQPVAYHRCRGCGFLFTTAFNHLSDAELGALVYNDEYPLADPDFAERRPAMFARTVAELFPGRAATLRLLDFGGGNGAFAARLRAEGFAASSHDPYFSPDAAPPPAGSYDLVTAFEVFEHSRNPIATARLALSFAKPDGALLFSTLLVPPGVDMSWWYIAPRNGHVSLHSEGSLERCARALGCRFTPLGEALHMFHRGRAGETARRIAAGWPDAALFRFSLRGTRHLAQAALAMARAGQARAALSPRHFGRAIALDLGLLRRPPPALAKPR